MKNHNCRMYLECLQSACDLRQEGFDCIGCHLQEDVTRQNTWDDVPICELTGICRLLIEVFPEYAI